MPLSSGEVIHDRYRIVKLLGQGGFGAVYRAWDLNLQRPCAIKENLEVGIESKEQFEREARMLSNLSHPNLPRVTDYFTIQNQGQYLVMDFVEGEDLQTKMDHAGGPLPEEQVLPWIGQISAALEYLHNQTPPIIHRDIKPMNIIIRPDGQAFIVDFGIAKLFDPAQMTTIGARAVTPGYSPIEQYGHGKTDARSDIYALGATLYTMLTGMVPVESVQRNETSLPSPRALNAAISPPTERTILRAMELSPAARYSTMADFSSDLYPPEHVQIASTAVVSPAVAQTVAAAGSGAGAIPPDTVVPGAGAAEAEVKPFAWRTVLILLLLLVIIACAAVFGIPAITGEPLPVFAGIPAYANLYATDTPTPTTTREPTHTATATPTVTPSPSFTPTRTPTATRTPTKVSPTSRPTNTPRPSSTPAPTRTTRSTATSSEILLGEPNVSSKLINQGGCGTSEATFVISATGPVTEDGYLMYIFWNIQDKVSGSSVGWNNGHIMQKRRGENVWTFTFNPDTMINPLPWQETWLLYQFVLQERSVDPQKYRTRVYSDVTLSRCP